MECAHLDDGAGRAVCHFAHERSGSGVGEIEGHGLHWVGEAEQHGAWREAWLRVKDRSALVPLILPWLIR